MFISTILIFLNILLNMLLNDINILLILFNDISILLILLYYLYYLTKR